MNARIWAVLVLGSAALAVLVTADILKWQLGALVAGLLGSLVGGLIGWLFPSPRESTAIAAMSRKRVEVVTVPEVEPKRAEEATTRRTEGPVE